MTMSNVVTLRDRSGSAKASAVLLGLLVIFLGVVLFTLPEPTPFQRGIVRFFMALAAGFSGFFFMGGVVLNGKLAGLVVGASGGFALFIFVGFVVTPFDIKTSFADVAPRLLPADKTVVKAQEILTENGFYTGPITGKADSQTREAIKKFQASKNMKVNGFVRDWTGSILGLKPVKPSPTPP